MTILFPLLLLLTACGDSLTGPTWGPESRPFSAVTPIDAGDFFAVRFPISNGDFERGRNFVLSGNFEVIAGGSRDINAYVVDEIGYKNFYNGNNFRSFFSSTKVTTDRFSIRLSRADTYYVLFSNRFSIFIDKRVDLNIELRYETRE